MSARKIHIGNDIWKYVISTGNLAVIWSPGKQRHEVKLTDIVNRTIQEIQAGRYRDGDNYWMTESIPENGMIKPSDIKNYILKNLVK